MALDTARKRSSVWQVPGIMTNPIPSGTVDGSSREQISDVYAGIPAALPLPHKLKTCWVREQKVTDVWIPETKVAAGCDS